MVINYGFNEFFVAKLLATELYTDGDEITSEVNHTISNMEYDMKNGDDLMTAFNKACNDLHIEQDGIESFI